MKPAAARLHEFDALRAFAMLLGVVIHAAFFLLLLGAPDHQALLGNIMFVIHIWRMPLFFLIAGYFGAMVVARRGVRQYVDARIQRIAVPFVVALAITLPVMHYGLKLADPRYHGHLLTWPPPAHHLWFLWFLLVFTAVTLLARWAVERAGLRPWVARARAVVQHRAWLPLAIASFAALLWPEPILGLAAQNAFMPGVVVLLGFGLFFMLGWLLYGHPDPVGHIGRDWRPALVVAPLAIIAAHALADDFAFDQLSTGMRILAVLVSATATWAVIVALTGLMRQWSQAAHPAVRWTADWSYWLYLIHLPVVLLAVYAAREAGLSTLQSYVAAMAVTYVICFVTYCLVRHTVIGRTLHGPRPRRAAPLATSTRAPRPRAGRATAR